MDRRVLRVLATLLLATGACTACSASNSACEANPTPTMSPEELDEKC